MAKMKDVEESKTKKNTNKKSKVNSKENNVKKESKRVETKTKKVSNKNEVSKKDIKVVNKKKENAEKEVVLNENIIVETNNNSKKIKIIKGIIYSLISIIILGALIYSVIESNERSKYFQNISFSDVKEIMNEKESNIIYWAQPNCGFCTQFTPIVKKISYNEKIAFNYLNTANLTQDEYATMITYLSAYNEEYSSGVGTPSIIVVNDGKVVDVQVGALSEEGLISYLTSNKLIK